MRRLIHPVGARMLAEAGVDPGRYMDALDRVAMLDSWTSDDPAIAAMPRHSAGIGSRAVVMSVFLDEGVTFVTGPDEDGTRLALGRLIPETLRPRLVGRPLSDLVDHPLLATPGLVMRGVHDSVDAATGAASSHVELERTRWKGISGTPPEGGVVAGLRAAILG